MKNKPAIYTITSKADFSTSTVFWAINENFTSDEKVLEKGLYIIKQNNYVPSPEARRLMGKKIESPIIGVLAAFFVHPLFVEVLRSVHKNIHQYSFRIILYDAKKRN